MKTTISEAFQEFLYDKRSNGASVSTLATYRAHFNAASRFFDEDWPIEAASTRMFRVAVGKMAESGLAPTSIRSYTATLKSFFSWCRKEDLCMVSIRLYKSPETVPEAYTDEELQLLLKRPKRSCSFAELRNWTIVNLLVNNGLRAASVRSIKLKDVDLDQMAIVLRHTKRGRTQVLPLSPSMSAVMTEYIQCLDIGPNDYLFQSADGGQLTAAGLRSAIARYNNGRGVETVSIHAFRHTFARLYLVDCGGDALKLQKLLGHSTLAMTKHYVQIYDADLIADFQQHSPLERLKAQKKTSPKRRQAPTPDAAPRRHL